METIQDSDLKYIDSHKNLLRSRTELTIAQLLDFLGISYQYDQSVKLQDGTEVHVDFETEKGMIEVIDDESDIKLYEKIKKEQKIIAVGHPKFAAKVQELDELVYYNKTPQTGSIFLEDPSFTFDYAHILPLVTKCSILHGHTSSVMVELIGQMKNNLLLDFSEAKQIVKQVISIFDHKFFINVEYMTKRDDLHYTIQFDGPQGTFNLQVPKSTTYLLKGEATIENLASEIIRLLAKRLPDNIEAVGVYIYEGHNKGAHIISNIR